MPKRKSTGYNQLIRFIRNKGFELARRRGGKIRRSMREVVAYINREFGKGFCDHPPLAQAQELYILIQAELYPGSQVPSFPPRRKRPTRASKFFKSDRWRALRYKILARDNFTCLACGASRKTGAVLHVDHIHPRSRFPHLEWDEDNLQTLCEDCNLGKSNVWTHDFRENTAFTSSGE